MTNGKGWFSQGLSRPVVGKYFAQRATLGWLAEQAGQVVQKTNAPIEDRRSIDVDREHI